MEAPQRETSQLVRIYGELQIILMHFRNDATHSIVAWVIWIAVKSHG